MVGTYLVGVALMLMLGGDVHISVETLFGNSLIKQLFVCFPPHSVDWFASESRRQLDHKVELLVPMKRVTGKLEKSTRGRGREGKGKGPIFHYTVTQSSGTRFQDRIGR